MEEAINILQTISIDLVLLDIGLNGTHTGLDLGNYINQTFKIPFIYITSYHDEQTLAEIVKTFPVGYVCKPFKPEDLTSAVKLAFFGKSLDENLKKDKVAKDEFEKIPYRIKKVLKYIDEHIHERMDIDTLAAITSWHKQHFIRTFQKTLKTTPYQYILSRKIEKSCEMIIASDFPCSEIAFEFGFMSYANYNKAFKRIKNCTPVQYRVKFK